MQDKILFRDWEIGDKKRVPVLLQVFGAVILFHVAALGSVLYVPQLRDVFYLAQIFSDKGKAESRDYNKTDLGFDPADVVYVDPNGLFQYPEGYFADPNDPRFQQELAMNNGATNGFGGAPSMTFDPTIPPPVVVNPTPSYIPSTKDFPTYKPPRSSRNAGGSALPKLPKGKSPFAKPSPANSSQNEDKDGDGFPDNLVKEGDVAKNNEKKNEPKPSPTPKATPKKDVDEANTAFNPQPWKDFGRKIKEEKTIDLNNIAALQPTRIEVSGLLDSNGRLMMNPKPVPRKMFGDDNVAKFSLDIVSALNDSNMLTYIKDLAEGKETQEIKIVMEKGAENFEVFIESDLRGGAKRPENVAAGIQLALDLAARLKSGEPEGDFIKRVKVDNEKGILKIKFQMPNAEAAALIKKNIEGLDKPKEQGENTAGNTKVSPVAEK